MGIILCATRGGEASYRTQDAAIALAKDSGDELWFLYVVNTGFLHHTARAIREDVVEDEMERLGEFLLEMARERAASQGVVSQAVVRHGSLPEQLEAVVSDLKATTVVLGKPVEDGAYSLDHLQGFARDIEATTDAKARIL
jgi:hypothetical protein